MFSNYNSNHIYCQSYTPEQNIRSNKSTAQQGIIHPSSQRGGTKSTRKIPDAHCKFQCHLDGLDVFDIFFTKWPENSRWSVQKQYACGLTPRQMCIWSLSEVTECKMVSNHFRRHNSITAIKFNLKLSTQQDKSASSNEIHLFEHVIYYWDKLRSRSAQ